MYLYIGRGGRVVRVPVQVGGSGTDTATLSKLGQLRSPYIAYPFQPASLEG